MYLSPLKLHRFLAVVFCYAILVPGRVNAQRDAVTLTSADAAFNQQDFHNAFFGFESLYSEDTITNIIKFKAGISAVNLSLAEQALRYLKKVDPTDEEIVDVLPFWLGRAYHLNMVIDSAIFYYDKFLEFPFKKNSWEKKVTVQYLQDAKNLKTLLEGNGMLPCVITNLGSGVNSEYIDHSPLLSKDGKTLFFTTRRPATPDERILDGGEFFEKVFISTQQANGDWSRARPLFPFAVEEQSMTTIQLIENDTKLLVYLVKDETKGVFVCQKMGDKWLNPVKYEGGFTMGNTSKDAYYTTDNKMAVFTRTNHSNTFQYDIAYVMKDPATNTWGKSINPGKVINTAQDEVAPYFSQQKSTLYYSSKGEDGFGDFDIRKSLFNKTTRLFGEPTVMPFPVSSPGVDMHFREAPGSVKSFVMASARAGGEGTLDIYSVEFTSFVRTQGLISNQRQTPMPNMTLEIFDSTTFITQKVKTNEAGLYSVNLVAGQRYIVSIFAEKEFVTRTEFKVPLQPDDQEGVLEKNFLIIFPPEEQP